MIRVRLAEPAAPLARIDDEDAHACGEEEDAASGVAGRRAVRRHCSAGSYSAAHAGAVHEDRGADDEQDVADAHDVAERVRAGHGDHVAEEREIPWKIARREVMSGLALGAILGTIGFLRIALWSMFSTLYGPHWVRVGLIASRVFFHTFDRRAFGRWRRHPRPHLTRPLERHDAASFVFRLRRVRGHGSLRQTRGPVFVPPLLRV